METHRGLAAHISELMIIILIPRHQEAISEARLSAYEPASSHRSPRRRARRLGARGASAGDLDSIGRLACLDPAAGGLAALNLGGIA